MNPPLKIKQWHPSQPKRKTKPSTTTKNHEPRRVIASGSPRLSLCDDGYPPTADWGEFANFNPYEELRSIEDIIDEAMPYSASDSARGSISMPNPVPITYMSPRGTTCQAIPHTFSLDDEGAYSATEITTLPADIQPGHPVFDASPRCTTTSITIPEATLGLHDDNKLPSKMPIALHGRRCHVYLTSQAPPSLPMLEDEKDIESPDSISTSYEPIWTPPGVDYEPGHPGAMVQTGTYARSSASSPVQSCISSMTGAQPRSISRTGRPKT